jgi:hypothetical protein
MNFLKMIGIKSLEILKANFLRYNLEFCWSEKIKNLQIKE